MLCIFVEFKLLDVQRNPPFQIMYVLGMYIHIYIHTLHPSFPPSLPGSLPPFGKKLKIKEKKKKEDIPKHHLRTARNLKSDSFQFGTHIQPDMLRIGRKSLFEIREMFSVVYATVTHNVDGEKAVGEIGDDAFDDGGLVDGGSYGDRVVSWDEDEVVDCGGADEFVLDQVVECDVALKRIAHVSLLILEIGGGGFHGGKF